MTMTDATTPDEAALTADTSVESDAEQAPQKEGLSAAHVRFLRAQAHAKPAIMRIGSKRLTDAVVAHIDSMLEAHELIKIKMLDADRGEMDEARALLVSRTGAEAVHMIGGTLVLFRRRDKDPELLLPGERPFARTRQRVLMPARSKRTNKKPSGGKVGSGRASSGKPSGRKAGGGKAGAVKGPRR